MVDWIKLSVSEVKEILANYGLGEYKNRKHLEQALGNTVYFVRTTKGTFLLKVLGEADPEFVKYQVKITKMLGERKVPVARNVETSKGRVLLKYGENNILIQNIVEGYHPKRYSDQLIVDIAKNVALMQLCLMDLDTKKAPTWGDHQFRIPKDFANVVSEFPVKSEFKKLMIDLEEIDKSLLRKSVIHSDILGSNILVKNNKLVAFIDFDDMHFDYLVFDLAVIVTDMLVGTSRVSKDKITLFFKQYKKHIKLNTEEKKSIYYFVKYRILAELNWFEGHRGKGEKINFLIEKSIKKYKCFDKMNLNEFVKLI